MGLTAAGIDTTVFTPHSTRAASTSKAKARSVPTDIIMSLAGWLNATTFQRFYNKEIINNEDNMACALLDRYLYEQHTGTSCSEQALTSYCRYGFTLYYMFCWFGGHSIKH